MHMFAILEEEQLVKSLDSFRCATSKGYPEIVVPLKYYVRLESDSVLAYTSDSDMGSFYFVGNTYVLPENRGQGIYSRLLKSRNAFLNDKPKVTVVNPIEGTDINILTQQVAKQGGIEVIEYNDVCTIMDYQTYLAITKNQTLLVYIYV